MKTVTITHHNEVTVPIATLSLVTKIEQLCGGSLELDLDAATMLCNGEAMFEGRPYFHLSMPSQGQDWEVADSAALADGVARFLLVWRSDLQRCIDNLREFVPEVAVALAKYDRPAEQSDTPQLMAG